MTQKQTFTTSAACELSTLTTVRKRNGDNEPFNISRIEDALYKAGRATGEFNLSTAKQLAIRCVAVLYSLDQAEPEVEAIQDVVEEVLLNSSYKKTAKAYILFRAQHSQIRLLTNAAQIDIVDNYLAKLDWKVKENSNMGYSLQGLNNYISSEISSCYWLNKIYPKNIQAAHSNGDIHIHDLNQLSVYCVGWDLYDLLHNGFKGVSGKAQSGPASHFRSALGQVVNFFYTMQGEAAGAQALSSFDTLLAPFIRYDNLSYDEVKHMMKGFVFNLNVPTRVGFQAPFTNLTLDLRPSINYKDQNVLRGGVLQKETYGAFQYEMSMLNKALFETLSEGDDNGRVFTFPIPTINIDKHFDWENPEYNEIWNATARYGIPYFANFINSDMSPEDTRSMCCRLRLNTRELEKRGGGLFGANPLTGSIGVVTINMPRIAHQTNCRDTFFALLDDRLELAKESLELKRKVIENFAEKNLYPYCSYYLRQIKTRFNQYWSNHFSTIGLVGMHEACQHLLGEGIDSAAGLSLAEQTLHYIREKMQSFQESTGNYYNLEATPAESTGLRLSQLDREIGIHQDNEMSYTNSTQLPVNHSTDIAQIVSHQNQLQPLYTGGTVLHIYTGEENIQPTSARQFIRRLCENTEMPYFTISPTFSVCPSHGYLSGRHDTCPSCAKNCEVYSRVVGYLRPVDQWNNGKQAEFEHRASINIDACQQRGAL